MLTIRAHVEELFSKADDRYEAVRTNPVTGGKFVADLDPIDEQLELAEQALIAQAWLANQEPELYLPTTYQCREELKAGGAFHYVASLMLRSLAARGYRVSGHPDVETYFRGVMASPLAPGWVKNDPDMLRRYPPKPLEGLGGGLIWRKAIARSPAIAPSNAGPPSRKNSIK